MNGNMKTLLTLSLALNLLLAGLIGGHMAKRALDRPSPAKMIAQFPADKQDDMQRWWKDTREANKKDRETMDEARQELMNILTAPTFDATAYAKQSTRLNETRHRMMQRMSSEVGSLAATLTGDERAILARSLRFDKKMPEGR